MRTLLGSLSLLALSLFAATPLTDGFSIPTTRARLRHHPLWSTDPENPLEGGELTSALARLDREWKLQQEAKGPDSRWTKLILPTDDFELVTQQEATYETLQDFVYLLEPPRGGSPSSVIVFLGGAGLGQFPQIAYNEFLIRVSDKLNFAAVIAAPYLLSLDHFSLSKQSGERLRKAVDFYKESLDDPSTLPTYCLAHSLGCKLQTIYMAATQQQYDKIGFLAYNNFSFSQTMSMAKDFAKQLQTQQGRPVSNEPNDLLSTIFDFAELAIGAIGLDFSPTQAEMNQLIEMRYDNDYQEKTRLFVFDDDTLDSSRSFVQDCRNGVGPTVSGLPGNHLTPVFFELGMGDLPEEARGMAEQATGGMKGASFGNEQELDALVDEVCDWINGQGPSRGPDWN